MSANETPIHLPTDIPYPITIKRLIVTAPSQVQKTQALFSYGYWTTGEGGQPEQRVQMFESPVEGELRQWFICAGQTVKDSTSPALSIYEPCTHEVQLHGLCALCGKDLTAVDYTGFSDTSRADVSMVHDSGGLTVSMNEAHRLEIETTQRLLKERKLSLIVDLDQTIVHATVDPTVGEWQKDSNNPNFEVLQEVKKFQLKEGPHQDNGAWYYLKLRPSLEEFLEKVSKIYELHVYTMGTRAYAVEVCKSIDPTQRYFGGRILSRDESGSLTRKSLERLFPCDTSMVVVIDDRADVWNHGPNLVKAVPYEFFMGIGDINAAFLPKNTDITNDPRKLDADPDSKFVEPSEKERETKAKTPVWIDEDQELIRIQEILISVRDKFYDGLQQTGKADVKTIIPHLKRQVFRGLDICFSGVVALGTRPQDSEYWKAAIEFGASCSERIRPETTHVVAHSDGTAKVMEARQDKTIFLVNSRWLIDSVSYWERRPEALYNILPHAPFNPPNSISSVSSNPTPPPEPDESPPDASLFQGLDWAAAADEVDQFLNATDDDSDVDSASESTEENRKRSRSQSQAEFESPLQKRLKSTQERKSRLSASVSFPDVDDEDSAGQIHTSPESDADDLLNEMEKELEKGWE